MKKTTQKKRRPNAAFLFVAFLWAAAVYNKCAVGANDAYAMPAPPPSTPTGAPTPTPADVLRQAKLAFTGDIMSHAEQISSAFNKKTGEYDFTPVFREVESCLKSADLAIGNLETVFAGAKAGYSGYPRFNAPDAYAGAIAAAGFGLLSTANNHCNDKNEAGLFRTLDVLDEYGIGHVGTHRSAAERDQIKVVEADGISFAFLSYTYGTNGLPLVKGHAWSANLLSKELVKNDIQMAKGLDPDFVVVLPHMGDEYAQFPSTHWLEWFQYMFDCGADIVMASHPHVLQPVSLERGESGGGAQRVYFADYSMGNFVSSQRTAPRDEGAIVNLYFEKKNEEKARLAKVSFIPTWVMYINANGAYDIHPVPLHRILAGPLEDIDMRAKDIARAKSAHAHITEVLLGGAIPAGMAEQEYFMDFE